MEKNIDKTIKVYLRIMLGVTLMLIAGIVFLSVGLSLGITALTALGGAFIGVGFLGSFYGWVFFALLCGRRNLLNVIKNNNLSSVAEIAKSVGKSKGTVRRDIRSLISAGYLVKFKYNMQTDELLSTEVSKYKCPSCGAPHSPTDKVCRYCGCVLRA
ncbi:MAG: winged helix-turn-helix transcriptional regulator [Clostridiales bacterium]|jgi:hypothetical protein|nr:winged helix-turn-helix transcriptional regulator [Clostridiales bacterium]